jgi:hypothetical protein
VHEEVIEIFKVSEYPNITGHRCCTAVVTEKSTVFRITVGCN